MKFKILVGIVFATLIAILALAGCGGSSSGGSNAGSVSLFLTDDLSTNYDGVWVTVFEADLVRADNSKVQVFESTAGMAVNLRALNNGTGQYLFAGNATVPSGSFTKLVLHLSKSLTLFATGSTSGQAVTFIDSLDGSSAGRSELVVPFSPAATFQAGDRIAADFKLDQWTLAGGKVTPVVAKGDGSGLDDHNRHVEGELRGTVSNLTGTAPVQTFTVSAFGGAGVTVTTSSTTAIIGKDAATPPTLANGLLVEVRAQFNPVTNGFEAKTVAIEESGISDEQKVAGKASNINSGAGSFDVTPGRTKGFVPSKLPVTVLTSTSTRFMTSRGVTVPQADFFTALTAMGANAVAEAEGTFDAGTGKLSASKVKIDDDSQEGEAEAKGTVASADTGAGTLQLVLSEWEGFSFNSANQLPVTTDTSTQYADELGVTMTKEAFFTAATSGKLVKAHGTFSAAGLAANRLQVRTGGGGGGGGEDSADAKGYASDIDTANHRLKVKLVDWTGFGGMFNQVVQVQMADGATYRLKNGSTTDATGFFAALQANATVQVEGSFASGTFTATKAKIDD